jgi:hypothetical protein
MAKERRWAAFRREGEAPAEPWQCSRGLVLRVARGSRKGAKEGNRRFSVGIRAVKKKTLRLGVFAREIVKETAREIVGGVIQVPPGRRELLAGGATWEE